ncbi:YlxR family protein [Seleniivibrio woodruffii]|uniref:YlxR family protein n=1 Tax=Seleniivibrio woodruffii TaxID=1078050 RepID=UPI003C6F1FEC
MKRVIRTCVSCGIKREKTELIRFVYSDEPQEDAKGNRQGRGAYVCDNEKCREIGLNRKKLTRSLLSNQLRRTR